ncbi:hypothetical protein HPB52_008751 [Rhipicephalus sanguineus]|uniref:Uncharacterized protein n=1 Tax=Rhipicephalus sanguineus TaxID=34632 RepID=A0A9D4SS15_RHISA|nr:hypothetical protein HPB52_008751 [Rhipicephalus sanguineus]
MPEPSDCDDYTTGDKTDATDDTSADTSTAETQGCTQPPPHKLPFWHEDNWVGGFPLHSSLRASALRCGGGSEELDAVGLAANLGTATAARQHGDVARVSEQRRSCPWLKNSPGGTLNSIRRGSQVEDEHRGVAQARGRHPGVDPVGRTARDETRAKDVTRTHSLRASVLRCGGGSEELDAVGLAANLGTATAARQHGDVARVSEQRRSWPWLKNSPGGTLNSIRRGSQVEDEHRGVAQARGRHPGVDPVGRTARDETRAKDGRPVTGAGARPSSGGRDDGEAGTEPELHALSATLKRSFSVSDWTRDRPVKRIRTEFTPAEEIYCYVVPEPIESSLGRISHWLSALCGWPSKTTHCALAFLLPGRTLKVDAVSDDEECLVSRVQRVAANHVSEADEKVLVGSFCLTEDHLYNLKQKMGHLGPYDVRQNNCQTFVLECLLRLEL